jgi:OOP family OmpA-OmpF porin
MRLCCTWIALSFLFAGLAQAQEMEIQVELMGSLSAKSSRKGDRVFARVVSPQSLEGDTVEGKVNNVRAGGKFRGESVLNFSFETLQHQGESIPISSQVKSITNSKGQQDVDEEGRVVRKNNNVAKALAGTAVGGLIGGIAGGAKGAAIGAGAGAAASIILIEVAAQGPDIRLDPGSRATLIAQSRSGPALTSLSSNPAPVAANTPAPAATQAPAQPAAPAAAVQATKTSSQPNLTEVKSDFVPGEKTIFFDDFSDMAGDEPPPHWKVRGGSFALKTGEGIRQLTTSSTATMIPNLSGLPKNFTVEAELKFDNPGDFRSIWTLKSRNGIDALRLFTQTQNDNFFVRLNVGEEELGTKSIQVNWNDPVKLDWWLQNGRLRVYVNGQRQIDVNQITLPGIASAEVLSQMYGGEDSSGIGYRMVRFAESTPDFSQMISSSGRYVTHGILFDTDSDRLKPESAPVIKQIAQGLQANPNLKLQIEGHTDSTGGDEHNLDLSKRRAEAVKSVLVSQFGIGADRLTTMGLGASKPIDTNDTPAGRAQNRRVEFVRMQAGK